jgi:hypothetical protein
MEMWGTLKGAGGFRVRRGMERGAADALGAE